MEEQARRFAKSEDPQCTAHALETVFRRLLANLLLDFDNPKFRKVRPQNGAIQRSTSGLSKEFVAFLLRVVGFSGEPDEDGFLHFQGTKEDLKTADTIYTTIEDTVDEEKNAKNALVLEFLAQDRKKHQEAKAGKATHQQKTAQTSPPPNPAQHRESKKSLVEEMQEELLRGVFNRDDFSSVESLRPVVTKALLSTGRVRNSFFDAKGLTIRRMEHGRVYACSEKCSNDCVEAHWHLYTGKGMLYAYVAHLSPDGKTLVHTGAEHGYQYNSIPGTPNFGKTIHFSEKLVAPQGHLVYNEHPNKVAESCIYCGQSFYKLFM